MSGAPAIIDGDQSGVPTVPPPPSRSLRMAAVVESLNSHAAELGRRRLQQRADDVDDDVARRRTGSHFDLARRNGGYHAVGD
jgi:hypothetical protein